MTAHILKKFLDDHHVKYLTIQHSPAFTSQEIAEITHVPAREFAKTVIVNIDGKLAMIVTQAHKKLDFKSLKHLTQGKTVELASEYEFQQRFQDCELGAMPPFGNLFDMVVYVDKDLTKDEEIAFNAGSHAELLRMHYSDYARLVHPKIIQIPLQAIH